MAAELTIKPPSTQWMGLIDDAPAGEMFGRSQAEWRSFSREQLGLDAGRPIIATGHQALLWHPGILAKYMAVDAFAAAHGLAKANLIVDQHAEGFGTYDVPVRRADGALMARQIELCRPRPRREVPMGMHEAFTPPRPPSQIALALDSIRESMDRITEAVYAHREAPNAALQMARAIERLMSRWVGPMPMVTSADLIRTDLARRMLERMVEDPWRCAEAYNRAVAAVPEAGINPLLIRDDYVELPLWRIRDDGRRMHAYDADADRSLRSGRPIAPGTSQERQEPRPDSDRRGGAWLLPRALFMTALVRLAMCDLFIHGFGGAVYDRTMELWMNDWLGVRPGHIAVVSATLHLPLEVAEGAPISVAQASSAKRRLWHDPDLTGASLADADAPSAPKREMLQAVNALPRRSAERRRQWLAMHAKLESRRGERAGEIAQAVGREAWALRQAGDRMVASRRDWAFPLYPQPMLDELAKTVMDQAGK